MSCFFSSQVIAVVFQYLDMLRREGPKKRIFDEAKTIADNSFHWEEQVNITLYLREVIQNLDIYIKI